MFCTNCGKKINDTAAFCPECGSPTLNHNNFNQSSNALNNEKRYLRTMYADYIVPDKMSFKDLAKMNRIYANVIFEDNYIEIQNLDNPKPDSNGFVKFDPNQPIASVVRIPYSDIKAEIKNCKAAFTKWVAFAVKYQGKVYSFCAAQMNISESKMNNYEFTGTYICNIDYIEEFERIIRMKNPAAVTDLR